MNTPITNGLLNLVAQAKRHHIDMAEIRMTRHTYDRLRVEGANGLYIPNAVQAAVRRASNHQANH